jgi:hypothetical protein
MVYTWDLRFSSTLLHILPYSLIFFRKMQKIESWKLHARFEPSAYGPTLDLHWAYTGTLLSCGLCALQEIFERLSSAPCSWKVQVYPTTRNLTVH